MSDGTTSLSPLSGRARAPADTWLPRRALSNVLFVALAAGLLATAFVLFRLGGLEYYRTPLALRGYEKDHRLLRSAGPAGHSLGIIGTGFLIMTLPYMLRKKVKRLSKVGTMKGWLEFHIFCGLFGPVLITLHTTLKFNGIVSVSYWSMVLVVASGFVGRYLFVRIPKTIRGKELDRSELEQRALELKERLYTTSLPASLIEKVETLERDTLALVTERRSPAARLADGFRVRRQMRAIRREVRRSALAPAVLEQTLELIQERALLLRRIVLLNRRKELFAAWHVFHKPLVYVMFLILVVHVAVALYFGYAPMGLAGGRP
jgi:hypothetical protein